MKYVMNQNSKLVGRSTAKNKINFIFVNQLSSINGTNTVIG